jgi:glycosyltransferase involved in cell wall biosynthesis
VSTPDLSIVVVARRGGTTLARCLAALAAQRELARVEAVVVVREADDRQSEAAAEAPSLGERLRHVTQPRGRGPAAGRNLGVAHVATPATLLVDDDVALAPDAVDALVTAGVPVDASAPSLIGVVTGPANEPVTPFQHWVASESCVPDGVPPAGIDTWRVYFGGIAVTATGLLRRARFDERLVTGGFEGLELAARLERTAGHRARVVSAAAGRRLDAPGLVDTLALAPALAEGASRLVACLDDRAVADVVGVTAAREVDRFVWRDLELAATLVGALEPDVHVPPRATGVFGERWEWECLTTAYRMLRRFFVVSALRSTLGLPVATATDATMDAHEAQVLLLERFARLAREAKTRRALRRPEVRA